MTNELTPIQSGVALPGCRLYPQGLELTRELTDEECQQALNTLRTARAATEFWFGDFLLYDLKRKAIPETRRDAWLGEFAHMAGLEEREVRRWVRVADYYPWQTRLPLSFSHHVEAMAGAGDDRQLAWAWLGEASEQGLTPSQFRAKIRKAQRSQVENQSGPQDPGPPEDGGADREVAMIERWCLQRLSWAGRSSEDEARAVLADLRHTADFIDRLRDRLAPSHPPLKESLSIDV